MKTFNETEKVEREIKIQNGFQLITENKTYRRTERVSDSNSVPDGVEGSKEVRLMTPDGVEINNLEDAFYYLSN